MATKHRRRLRWPAVVKHTTTCSVPALLGKAKGFDSLFSEK